MAFTGSSPDVLTDVSAEFVLVATVLRECEGTSSNEVFDRMAEEVTADDLSEARMSLIWMAMGRLAERNTVISIAALRENFRSTGQWDVKPGFEETIDGLFDYSSTVLEARDQAGVLRRLAGRRRLAEAGKAIMDMAKQPGHDEALSKLFNQARERIDQSDSVRKVAVTWENARAAVTSVLADLERDVQEGRKPGLSSGLSTIDGKLGMFRGDLCVLAGRPSMGKTAVAMNLARNMSKHTNEAGEPLIVCLFSQEMDRVSLSYRLAAGEARRHGYGDIAYQDLRSGELNAHQVAILKAGLKHIPENFIWNTAAQCSLADIKAAVRKAKRSNGRVDVVVIDYLQIMNLNLGRNENTVTGIGRITSGLKQLAKEENALVILLSQLSREVEKRDNKRPQLSDLRDSGAIEQDADAVLFTYRDDYYVERAEPPFNKVEAHANWMVELSEAEGKLELIIAKQRMGPIGTVALHFEKQCDLLLNSKKELKPVEGSMDFGGGL